MGHMGLYNCGMDVNVYSSAVYWCSSRPVPLLEIWFLLVCTSRKLAAGGDTAQVSPVSPPAAPPVWDCVRSCVCVCEREREGGKSTDTLEGFGAFPSHAVGSSGKAPAEAGGAVLKISSHLLKFFFSVSSSFPYWWRRGEQVLRVGVIISPLSSHLYRSHQAVTLTIFMLTPLDCSQFTVGPSLILKRMESRELWLRKNWTRLPCICIIGIVINFFWLSWNWRTAAEGLL